MTKIVIKIMKILAAGDIHGDKLLVRELAKRADKEKVDLVVLCGDLTLAESSTQDLIGPFLKNKIKVAFVPGNHESLATADFLADFYKITNLHNNPLEFGGIGLFGCGGGNIGLSQLSEMEIYGVLKNGFERVKDLKTKIMITHVHPSGTLMEKFTNFFPGSIAIRKAVESFKPKMLLCSHVHEAEGVEENLGSTKVINVGRKGKIIEI